MKRQRTLRLWSGVLVLLLCYASVAEAQRPPRPEEIGQLVYEKLPNLERANTYRGVRSGELRPTDTLVSRLIRFHQQNRNRRLASRLDWKITMADLLGVNGVLRPEDYPGFETLSPNPLQSDLQAIAKLTRAERDRLIDAILAVVPRPQTAAVPPEETLAPPEVRPTPPVPTPAVPPLPALPGRGSADLLR
ncbi:hypothetical protein VZG28_02835 [Synechococcus elongatus IITB4]|uniref:hypothetical protein n=1 Tax=Synechococcus elongatus TaxID=32046 RepID=UPI0030D1B9B1